MTAPTPWPTPGTMASMSQAAQYVNSSTNYIWGVGLVFAWWLVLFMAFAAQPFPKRFAAASWLAMIFAFFMEAMGVIAWNVTGVFVGICALATLFLLVFT